VPLTTNYLLEEEHGNADPDRAEHERQLYDDCEACSGLINPLANQRKINVGLSCLGEQHDDDDRDCVHYGAGAVAGLLH